MKLVANQNLDANRPDSNIAFLGSGLEEGDSSGTEFRDVIFVIPDRYLL